MMNSNEEDIIRQLLDPLQKAWPKIHLELCEAISAQYDPGRLGEILATEIGKEIDSAKAEFEPNLPKLGDKDEVTGKGNYKNHHLTASNLQLQEENARLRTEIDNDSDLINSQEDQINNLLGLSDQD